MGKRTDLIDYVMCWLFGICSVGGMIWLYFTTIFRNAWFFAN